MQFLTVSVCFFMVHSGAEQAAPAGGIWLPSGGGAGETQALPTHGRD